MVRVRGRQGPTIFLAASERDFWTCYLHPASNTFCVDIHHISRVYVTVPRKRVGGGVIFNGSVQYVSHSLL